MFVVERKTKTRSTANTAHPAVTNKELLKLISIVVVFA